MDILTPEKRKQNMQAIHSKDTKPEIYLRKLLFSLGYRYRSYAKNIPSHPDIYLRKYNTAIFINGCFWHRHKNCKFAYMPKSNIDFWKRKFCDNVERDKKIREQLMLAVVGAVGMCVNGQRGGAVGKLAAFPSGREYLFSIGGAAVFHISMV